MGVQRAESQRFFGRKGDDRDREVDILRQGLKDFTTKITKEELQGSLVFLGGLAPRAQL
jgi:hypothetical protein